MRRVKNRAVIRNIAWASIRENKKKHTVILLAILLTATMFTTLFSVAMSLNASFQNSTMRQVGGSSMAGIKCGLPEDYEKIKNDTKVVNASYRITVGIAQNEELTDLQTEVNYATDENAVEMFCSPTTGTMPKEKMDIAMSTMVLDAMGIAHELGQTVRLILQIGRESAYYEFTLCGFWEGDPVSMAQECFVSREFADEVAPTPSVPSYENEDMYTGYWQIDFNFRNSFDIEGQTNALLERNGFDMKNTMVGINWAYSTSTVDPTSMLLLGGGLLLILLAGYLIIYNIFYINVVADIHSYGLLKTVGTTGKQLKRIVRSQAMFFCAIGIPLGLLIGTLLAKGLFPVIAGTLTMQESSYIFSVSPWIYVGAILFTVITVWISSSKPCRVAAKVSPVEAVSYTEHADKGKSHRKSRRITTFGMAWAGLGRNRKKIVVVVLSLSLSLLLVNGVCTIVRGFDADKYIANSIVGDFSIQDSSVYNHTSMSVNYNGVSEEDRAFFDSLDGVTQHNVYWCGSYLPITEDVRKMLQQFEDNGQIPAYLEEEVSYYKEARRMNCTIYGVDEFALDFMTVYEGTLDPKEFATGKYAIVYSSQLIAYGEDEGRMDCYHVGDSITLQMEDGTEKTYEVMAVAELAYPLQTQRYSTIGADVCVPAADVLDTASDKGALYSVLTVEPDQMANVEQAVKQYVEQSGNLSYVSRETYLQEFRDYINMFYLVGGALAAVLALIGILNFINAIVTGMLARQQEFAMMEAVGMTERQLAHMLVWEGICYAIFTMVFAIAANCLVGRFLIEGLAGDIWFFTYQPTIAPLLVCLPVLILLAAVIPYLASRSLHRRSVVERMRIAE